MAKCRGCGANIVFIKLSTGKSTPCNANMVLYKEDPHGVERVITPNGENIRCTLDATIKNASGYGYKPHWGDCPAADKFRRRGNV